MSERSLNRFSQIYLHGGAPLQDSNRFRVRVAAFFDECAPYNSSQRTRMNDEFERECGVKLSSFGMYSSLKSVFEKGQIRDVLDAISIVYRLSPYRPHVWKTQVSRCFLEENLAYRLDEKCVVQRFVDEEFFRSTTSAIQSLDSPQLAGAAAALKQALNHLTGLTQNTKAAVTSTFESCEIIAKHLVPEAQNLHANLCKTKLLKLCMSPTAGAAEEKVETGTFTAMAEWVNAVHNYRHGQAEQEPVAPHLELAIQLVSMGCSFIRRLSVAFEVQQHQLTTAIQVR